MKPTYLEDTFRRGRPLAAYLYLPRRGREKSYRTTRAESGLVIDFNREEKPMGIEITAPTRNAERRGSPPAERLVVGGDGRQVAAVERRFPALRCASVPAKAGPAGAPSAAEAKLLPVACESIL